jgi:UDP-N-acetylmuramoyl-L-alanyl-D-glutamate--2,6-diaminopimelate ligase
MPATPGGLRPRDVRAVLLGDLVAVVAAHPESPADEQWTQVAVTGVTHDSSRVRPGDLYVAIRGGTRHGAEFTAQAVEAGAVAVLTDEDGLRLVAALGAPTVPVLLVAEPRESLGAVAAKVYGEPTTRLRVIGLTGTAGKTSTAYLVESGLAAAGHTTCMIGTVETRIAGETLDSVRTTPEATDLHALFASALERGVTAAVMEVSSHALSYGRVGGVRFDVGGYTNFGQDHLDFHTTVEEYFAAKAKLFDGRCRVEVLNLDDPAVRRLVRPRSDTDRSEGASGGASLQVTYSASGDPAATWRAERITRVGFTQRFTAVHATLGPVDASVSLPGRHNVANALLALACLVEAGVPPQVAAGGVGACRGVPGRLELVAAPGQILGVVDYAHKPDAIVAALAALRDVAAGDGRSPSGRLICVIGAGGDRDRGKRPLMGSAAAHGADVVIVTDDNPRSEDPAAIRAEVLAGVVDAPAQVLEVPGRQKAIAEAVRLARAGDVVAVLGKGHERGQETAGVVTPFDDRVELAAALAERDSAAREPNQGNSGDGVALYGAGAVA